MKREILCVECGTPKGIPIGSSADALRIRLFSPQEFSKYFSGKALRYFHCDNCGKEIQIGEDCKAVSTFHEPREYFEWEEECVRRDL